MKSCLPQYHAEAVVICLFTQWLLTSKVCWSSWLVTHPDNTQECGKGGGAKFVLLIIKKTTNSPSLLCFCDFLKLSVRPGSPSLHTVTSSVHHQYGWDPGRREKNETFPKYQRASGSVGTTLDVLLSSVSYSALRGNESWYHAFEWLNHAESLPSLDSYFVFY